MNVKAEHGQYVDNGDGTISDMINGIMWMKADSWTLLGDKVTWIQSHEFAKEKNSEKFAGYKDWRVPTSQDAKTLFHGDQANTDKDGCEIHIHPVFEAGGGFTVWTSETRAAKQAMGYDLRDDYEFWLDKNNQGFPSSVRLVRSFGEDELTVPDPNGPEGSKIRRFDDSRKGVIDDRKTGLMWKKTDSFLDMDKWISWEEAKVYVIELNKKQFSGYNDWQIPTRKEALTIFCPQHAVTDTYGDTVFLPPEFPPGSGQTTWTKTQHKTDRSLAVRVFYYNGDYKWHKKGLRSHGVRPVRGTNERED
tara:strand:- start:4439 stop:5353 length:915 start_codon:yes stop_codon:yes gene_type:complete